MPEYECHIFRADSPPDCDIHGRLSPSRRLRRGIRTSAAPAAAAGKGRHNPGISPFQCEFLDLRFTFLECEKCRALRFVWKIGNDGRGGQ